MNLQQIIITILCKFTKSDILNVSCFMEKFDVYEKCETIVGILQYRSSGPFSYFVLACDSC